MKIGVFSDTHDHLPLIERAIGLFLKQGVEMIIHCGDYVAPFVVRAMSKLREYDIEILGVYGNNDGERVGLQKILGEVLKIHGDFHELEIMNHSVAVYHGTDARILDALIRSAKYDLVLSGHTHQTKVEKIGNTLHVNPGETCGYLTGTASVAVIEVGEGEILAEDVQIIELNQ